LVEGLSTRRHRGGDYFDAILDRDLEVEGEIVAPKGSKVRGKVVEVVQPGRVKGRASLSFALDYLYTEAFAYPVSTNSITMEAETGQGKDARNVGIATAVGATLGAIFGGKKGAAIGAGAGAGAGTTGVLLSRGDPVEIEKESFFSFRLEDEIQVRLE
jgi:hypothetical protein